MKKRNIALTLLLACSMIIASLELSFAATASQKTQEAKEAGKKAKAANEKVVDLETMAYNLEKEIESAKAEISSTKAKLSEKQAEVKAQEGNLNERLTAMYKTGSVGIVDVILNSSSIQDLIMNVGMVQKILKNDQDILSELQDDYKEIEKLQEQQEAAQKKLEEKNAEVLEMRDKYKDEATKLAAQEKQLYEEAKALQKEAEEAAKEEEANRPSGGGSSGGGGGSSGGGSSSSGYRFPTASNYIITSPYGWRWHPIWGDYRFHEGVDICLTSGTSGAPVYAIDDGTVTKASWYGGYGNCIMISFGNGYVSLYGHLSGYNVSHGQRVKKGQVVGYIGNTGNSTGDHLHYTLYRYGELVNPMSIF